MPRQHLRWQDRWFVSLAGQEACHDSGLVYDWVPGCSGGPPPLCTLPCYDMAGQPWVGHLRGGKSGLQRWLDSQPAQIDAARLRGGLLPVARRAGEVYAAALREAIWVSVRP